MNLRLPCPCGIKELSIDAQLVSIVLMVGKLERPVLVAEALGMFYVPSEKTQRRLKDFSELLSRAMNWL